MFLKISYKKTLLDPKSSTLLLSLASVPDTDQMPPGKLSKTKIAKGFEILEEIQGAQKKKKTQALNDLASQFYAVIPTDSFCWDRPPVIDTEDLL